MQWLGHHHAHIQVLHAEIFKPTDVFSQDTPCVAPCIWNHTMSRCVLQVCGRTSVFNYQTLEMALDCFLIASATSAWSNTLRAAFGNTNKNRKVNDGQALTCQLTGVTWRGGGRSTPTERTSGLKSGATAVSNPECRWGFGVGGRLSCSDRGPWWTCHWSLLIMSEARQNFAHCLKRNASVLIRPANQVWALFSLLFRAVLALLKVAHQQLSSDALLA